MLLCQFSLVFVLKVFSGVFLIFLSGALECFGFAGHASGFLPEFCGNFLPFFLGGEASFGCLQGVFSVVLSFVGFLVHLSFDPSELFQVCWNNCFPRFPHFVLNLRPCFFRNCSGPIVLAIRRFQCFFCHKHHLKYNSPHSTQQGFCQNLMFSPPKEVCITWICSRKNSCVEGLGKGLHQEHHQTPAMRGKWQ